MRAFHSGGVTEDSLTLIGMVAECNRLHKRMDAVYHAYAKQTGLSDAAFWLLYSLYERGAPGTQKDLCNLWFFSPQTINSALKALEQKGLLTLQARPGSRKAKLVVLTGEGQTFVERYIEPVVRAEEASWQRMAPEERQTLLALTRAHTELLEQVVNRILSSEDGSSE